MGVGCEEGLATSPVPYVAPSSSSLLHKMTYMKQENSENKNATGTGHKLTAYTRVCP